MAPADAVAAINMVHISRWRVTQGLMAGAGRILPPGGVLYLYGAYKENGVYTAPSNEAFDQDLRRRNPEWGVRDLKEVRTSQGLRGWTSRNAFRRLPTNSASCSGDRRS